MFILLAEVDASWVGSKSCIACTWVGSVGSADLGDIVCDRFAEDDGPACEFGWVITIQRRVIPCDRWGQ